MFGYNNQNVKSKENSQQVLEKTKILVVDDNLELLEEEQFMKKNQPDFYMKDMLEHLL